MADETGVTTKRLWIAVLVAVIGGNTTGILNRLNPNVRNDPMTGTQGRYLEKEVHRIDGIQQTMLFRMMVREEEADEILDLLRSHADDHHEGD